ncbi:MAG: hypothetical protein FWC26_11285 [Fibromonadales bacterium]|nr:hypothetical protein [Fibromonadales bacterium]
MKKRYLRAVLLFLGIAGIVAYSLYPSEKEEECLEGEASPYGDAQVEGTSFKCFLPDEGANCGMAFYFDDYENWNRMDSLVLNLQSSENFKELIVQILTFDPDNWGAKKPALKELHLNSETKRYSIAMQHFYTPDYWFEQQRARNTHNVKRFSSIMGLELYSGWKNPISKPLELKIQSICVEGLTSAPFVFLVIYIAILIIIAISVRIK